VNSSEFWNKLMAFFVLSMLNSQSMNPGVGWGRKENFLDAKKFD
jgi:hypothetical protein